MSLPGRRPWRPGWRPSSLAWCAWKRRRWSRGGGGTRRRASMGIPILARRRRGLPWPCCSRSPLLAAARELRPLLSSPTASGKHKQEPASFNGCIFFGWFVDGCGCGPHTAGINEDRWGVVSWSGTVHGRRNGQEQSTASSATVGCWPRKKGTDETMRSTGAAAAVALPCRLSCPGRVQDIDDGNGSSEAHDACTPCRIRSWHHFMAAYPEPMAIAYQPVFAVLLFLTHHTWGSVIPTTQPSGPL